MTWATFTITRIEHYERELTVADHLDDVEPSTNQPRRMARRDLLKKGALGAGVAGVVWTSPEIVGLATRPAYAAASSAPAGGNGPPTNNVSNVACSGDVTFNITIPCPPDGHGSKDITIPGGNCPIQVITVDSHWAVGTPTDTSAGRPNRFNDVHAQDKAPWLTYHEFGSHDMSADRPPYLITSVKRANANCSFTSANVSGTNTYLFNPTKTPDPGGTNADSGVVVPPGSYAHKFTPGAVSVSDFSVGWASDPNERADLGAPACGDATAATLKMTCI